MANTENTPSLALRRRDLPALLGALAAVTATLGFFVWQMTAQAPTEERSSAALAAFGRDAGDVALTDSNGAAVRWGDLAGPPRALFFGFTNCPEVCPTTMGDIAAAMARIGPKAQDLRIDFVTVDPERDTPEALHDYLQNFGPSFRGYSGTRSEIDRLAHAYRASYRRTDLEGGGYTMDHTTMLYLLNRRGAVVDVASYKTPPTRLDKQLENLLARR